MAARTRLAEVLAGLSLTTDLGSGMPFAKGLRTCVAASAFASALRPSGDQRRAVFQAALLRAIGCTAHAPENAAMFGDDVRFERALKELDPADPETFCARFGDWDPGRQKELSALVIERTPTTGVGIDKLSAVVGRKQLTDEVGVDRSNLFQTVGAR